MKYICPLIVVSDIKKARRFYEEILGQEVKIDFGENVTYHGDFAIHEQKHFESLLEGKKVQTHSNQSELYFEEDKISQLEEKLVSEGIEFAHPTMEQPWRQKVMRFYDFDGNLIEVGESLEHTAWRLHLENMPIEEIAKTTYLPVEKVMEAIQKYSQG